MPKVSIIVPIFKVEAFIGRCANSLMEQTLQDVEFIFVDDCTPDRSIEELKSVIYNYPQRLQFCRIVRHESNRGLPSARNTGLRYATGDYVYHCDSDDWMEPNMLEDMYDAALKNDADIVWSDFFISFEQNERYMRARNYKSADDLLRKGFLAGGMKYNVWNKLVRRSLYDGISFPDGHSMGEDMTMIMVAAKADKVVYTPEAYYHYVKLNANAYTQTMSQRNLNDILFNTKRIEDFLNTRSSKDYHKDIELFKLNVKLPFLISDKRDDYRRWKSWFPESNKFALANDELPFRTKLLQWMAAHNCWVYVWLYYNVVYRLVYGIIYK